MATETPLTWFVVASRWTRPIGSRDAVDIVAVVVGRWTAPGGNGDAIDEIVVVVVSAATAVDAGCRSTCRENDLT